jgi:hypothetical protein
MRRGGGLLDRESALPGSLAFRVHPELLELQITRQLLARYKSLIGELPVVSWSDSPPEVISYISTLILRKKPDRQSMADLKRQKVQVYQFVSTFRKLVWIDRTLQGEVTPQSLRDREREQFALLKQVDAPPELFQIWLKWLKRPQGQPARKRVVYLKALDYKCSHPQTTWPQLAKKFCGSSGDQNKLKSWILQTKATMVDIGIEVDLKNPDYSHRVVNKGSD